MRLLRKFQTIVSTLLLFFFLSFNKSTPITFNQSLPITKNISVIDNGYAVYDNTDYYYDYNYDGYLDKVYDNCDLYNNTGTEIVLEGSTSYDYGSLFFKTTFLFGNLTFSTSYKYQGQYYSETIDCYLTSTGALNAELNYFDASSDDELKTYYIDDYKDPQKLENFALQIEEPDEGEEIETIGLISSLIIGAIVALVVTYVIVAEIAEQDQAEINYKENKDYDTDGTGVGFECMIYNQNETNYTNHSPANYKFGFATFNNVGCEIASAYNLNIKLGRPEYLSTTIYKFEKWGIEYSVGWGYLGSNPRKIDYYLFRETITYIKFDGGLYGLANNGTAFDYYRETSQNHAEANLIISTWTDEMKIHTYFVEKTTDSEYPYITYNWDPAFHHPLSIDDLNKLIKSKNQFIVGYFAYE